jgi:hypothetical protein
MFGIENEVGKFGISGNTNVGHVPLQSATVVAVVGIGVVVVNAGVGVGVGFTYLFRNFFFSLKNSLKKEN